MYLWQKILIVVAVLAIIGLSIYIFFQRRQLLENETHIENL